MSLYILGEAFLLTSRNQAVIFRGLRISRRSVAAAEVAVGIFAGIASCLSLFCFSALACRHKLRGASFDVYVIGLARTIRRR